MWILDSDQLGFNRAEQYHQFHNGLGEDLLVVLIDFYSQYSWPSTERSIAIRYAFCNGVGEWCIIAFASLAPLPALPQDLHPPPLTR